MKPILTNKNKIYKIIKNTINTKNKNIKIKDNDQNIIFFNFLLIIIFIIGIIFLVFRYYEKKKINKENEIS